MDESLASNVIKTCVCVDPLTPITFRLTEYPQHLRLIA